MELENFATWLEIDLGILENNYRLLLQTTGTPVMPVVKANAYGHGLEEVARTLEKAGAQWFGVARIEEALLLRKAGMRMNILVLGYPTGSIIK
jgi:alanine racemase